VCPEGSLLPTQVKPGSYSVNGVCGDLWPQRLRRSIAVKEPREGVAVFTSEELASVLTHEDWLPGKTWTMQV
jgi:hypothetical protein